MIRYKNLAYDDLREDSRVQFNPQVRTIPAGCDPDPAAHPIVASFADDFNRPNGPGFQSGNWREVQNDASSGPYPNIATCHLNLGALENFRPTGDGSHCVGGLFLPAPNALNWYVSAVLGPTHRPAGQESAVVMVAAPISQSNPLDPIPPVLSLTYWCWICKQETTVPPTQFDFFLGSVVNGIVSFVAPTYHAPVGSVSPGTTFGLRIVCNGQGATLRGDVDGIVVRTVSPFVAGNKPAGRPGVGNFFETLPAPTAAPPNDNFSSVTSWSADQIS